MIFDDVLGILASKLSEKEMRQYILNIKYLDKESKSDLAVLEVPNVFISRWVKSKYLKIIAESFENITKTKTHINIKVKSKNKQTGRQKEVLTAKKQSIEKSTILKKIYTFDNFISGNSNQVAYSVAKSICESPSELYNPLFLYGDVGLGKTHLLHAIGNSFAEKTKIVIYATSEQFLNDFTDHLTKKTMDRFREKYRECELFLLDDIQFIEGKERLQEELFHTFNELQNNSIQMVFAADRHPEDLKGISKRLKSRFKSKMVADIQKPEVETKIAIIKKKCQVDEINLSVDIISYMASNLNESVREIEGAILRIHSVSNYLGKPITLDFVKDQLKIQFQNQSQESINIDQIINLTSKKLNVKPSEIRSKSKRKPMVQGRYIVIFLSRSLTQDSMSNIAKYFDMKDHSAVSKALKRAERKMLEDKMLKTTVEEIKAELVKVSM